MFSKTSIQTNFSLIFILTLILVASALFVGLYQFRVQVLRNEAQAVANQVISFRSWVAQSGMIWVNELAPGFHDYLASRPGEGDQKWYGKNPALATRELSEIVKASAKRATFRVTSDRFRQPANAPDPFEARAMEVLKQKTQGEFFEGFDEGEYRYIEPLYVTKACLKCHGDPKDAPQEVIDKYGADKAFGYQVGQLRGVISVRLPDITLADTLPTLANPLSIGLLILAFVLSYLYVDRGVIRRVLALTQGAEAIAEGDLTTELRFGDVTKTRNEIDHLYNSVNLLRNSLVVAMRRMQRR